MKIPCSVGILTFNSAASLERCLDSVKNFAEIIVCDGGSADSTLEIARSRGCVTIEQDVEFKQPDNRIADFSGVRNQMLKTATQPWFLYVDSDECLSSEAAEEIGKLVSLDSQGISAFDVPRIYELEGKLVECSSTYPNYQIRLFRLRDVDGFMKPVHERIKLKSGCKKQRISQPIIVPHESDVQALKKKYRDYYIPIELKKLSNLSFRTWLRWILWYHGRAFMGGMVKYLRNLFLCSGNKMPWKIEWLKQSYHLSLIYGSVVKIERW